MVPDGRSKNVREGLIPLKLIEMRLIIPEDSKLARWA
jgi:hypothetical protein